MPKRYETYINCCLDCSNYFSTTKSYQAVCPNCVEVRKAFRAKRGKNLIKARIYNKNKKF